ncbi:lysosome-associated membrane glycoprotein 3 [Stigmatopora argus]
MILGNDESIIAAANIGAHIYQPVLQPLEVAPQIGAYTMKSQEGEICIKATMGVQYILTIKKKSWFFNLDPLKVLASGTCHWQSAVLSLTLADNSATLQFTFKKEKNQYYVNGLTASLSPQPVCFACANKTYLGSVSHGKLFAASYGQSIRCKSANVFLASQEMSIKLVSLQMQAFNVPNGAFGEGEECLADYKKRMIRIILWAVAFGLVMIAMVTFLLVKEHRSHGYQRH